MKKQHTIYILPIIITMIIGFFAYTNTQPKIEPDITQHEPNIVIPHNFKNNKIFQQTGGHALIPIEFSNNTTCLIDGKTIRNTRYHSVKSGKHTLTCKNQTQNSKEISFFVGDIFVVSGQSNAAGRPENCELAPRAKNTVVVSIPPVKPFEKPVLNTDLQNPKLQNGCSAWISFGNEYSSIKGIPVGIIDLTWITPIESYIASKEHPFEGYFYSFFISELNKFKKISGFIWYHGESAGVSEEAAIRYSKNLAKLINYIREDINYKMPFFLINIGKTDKDEKNWGVVREGIREVAENDPEIYLASETQDLTMNCEEVEGSTDCIHLGQEGLNTLGKRIARNIFEILKGSN